MAQTPTEIDWSGWAQMFVALLALGYATYESRKARRERRLERAADERDRHLRAKPNLFGTWTTRIATGVIEFNIKNVGLGPAIITDYYFTYRGTKYRELDIESFGAISRDLGVLSESGQFFSGLANGTSIAPGETACMFSLRVLERNDASTPLQTIPTLFGFHFVYESIYGDSISEVTSAAVN